MERTGEMDRLTAIDRAYSDMFYWELSLQKLLFLVDKKDGEVECCICEKHENGHVVMSIKKSKGKTSFMIRKSAMEELLKLEKGYLKTDVTAREVLDAVREGLVVTNVKHSVKGEREVLSIPTGNVFSEDCEVSFRKKYTVEGEDIVEGMECSLSDSHALSFSRFCQLVHDVNAMKRG